MALQDRTVVITGASSGIGEAIARELSGGGARLVLTARRGDVLEGLARDLPGDCAVLAADVADPRTPERLLDLAMSRFGRVDALVNNAGALAMGGVDEVDVEAVVQMIRINFEAVVRLSYAFARPFKAQKSGHIINISSGAAFSEPRGMGGYAGTKAAVETFTGSMRVELGVHGVKVGAIAPGETATPMLAILHGERGPTKTPPAQPVDIAMAVRFMLEQPERANIAGLQLYAAAAPY